MLALVLLFITHCTWCIAISFIDILLKQLCRYAPLKEQELYLWFTSLLTLIFLRGKSWIPCMLTLISQVLQVLIERYPHCKCCKVPEAFIYFFYYRWNTRIKHNASGVNRLGGNIHTYKLYCIRYLFDVNLIKSCTQNISYNFDYIFYQMYVTYIIQT